ncbi:hypothetical protein S4054249_07590 [Pseudoalteromonas luteoviolacea]|uniref:Uncharacterized protein n=2 Tax=Pseudoalteromonas luteoviolacea TaxID=43657 RepID=A0A0F6AHV0_9GAMM|nr:hypothetical protein S4054249_07590 [Pseudoalteromonas luteoviolacea]AOT12631.1 hypothetical protein S40542_07590 [Pseudoalteromonas luteoviolacea]AOT17545.1 hypothetical protein S4054_07590 [Pseudoalteromonas luteoviolacea]KKE85738.1 hypothetical protein N479_24865 [Pseudoalteromonas luteoviolacea S4054]KZN61811.1 hypothetical protein N481_25805 [Pseudoalteromonas luteoviolacea S4047-1]
MGSIEKVVNNLPMIIHADIYDEESEINYGNFINCIARKAAVKFSNQDYKVFGEELNNFSTKAEKAMSDVEEMLKNGPPRPSRKLIAYIEALQPTIEECEEAHNIRAEF